MLSIRIHENLRPVLIQGGVCDNIQIRPFVELAVFQRANPMQEASG
jgi:hypothetical protein